MDVGNLNSWDVSGSLSNLILVVGYDEWSSSHDVSSVSVLSLSSPDLLGVVNSGELIS